MTAHVCREFDPNCYRCDLGRDEVISALAEEYHEENIGPLLTASGVPDEAVRSLRLRYISDALKNPEAVAQLYQWADSRDEEED